MTEDKGDSHQHCPHCKAWYLDPRTVCYRMSESVHSVRYCAKLIRFVDVRGKVV